MEDKMKDCDTAKEAIREIREAIRDNAAPGGGTPDQEALSRIRGKVDNERINEAVPDGEDQPDPKMHQPRAGYWPAG